MPPIAAVCRWSRDIRGMGFTELRTMEGRVYAGVGDVVAVIEALGVDPEQHFDAVPGPLGDARRRDSRAQPQRYSRVTQVVGSPGQA